MTLPVVFLPGIMGSRLEWADGRMWDPDSKERMLRWLVLAQKGVTLARVVHHQTPVKVMDYAAGLSSSEVERGWGGVVKSCYRSLMRSLQERGHAVYAVGYDWRQDLLTLTGHLAKRLAAMKVPERFLLVTHSMGGLLARAAFADPAAFAPSAPLLSRAAGAVHVCQPCHGAVVLYRRLFTGVTKKYDGETLFDRLFGTILGTNGPDFVTNVCGMPGALQLLPTADHQYPTGTRLAGHDGRATFCDDVFGHAASPPGVRPRGMDRNSNAAKHVERNLPASLQSVARMQKKLRGGHYHPRTWYFFADGLMTDVALPHQGPWPTPTRLAHGDGTVARFSAAPGEADAVALGAVPPRAESYRYAALGAVAHDQACNHPGVAPAVAAIAAHLA